MSNRTLNAAITQLTQQSFASAGLKSISKMLKNMQVFDFRSGACSPAHLGKESVAAIFEWVYAISAENLGNTFKVCTIELKPFLTPKVINSHILYNLYVSNGGTITTKFLTPLIGLRLVL